MFVIFRSQYREIPAEKIHHILIQTEQCLLHQWYNAKTIGIWNDRLANPLRFSGVRVDLSSSTPQLPIFSDGRTKTTCLLLFRMKLCNRAFPFTLCRLFTPAPPPPPHKNLACNSKNDEPPPPPPLYAAKQWRYKNKEYFVSKCNWEPWTECG